MTEKPDHLEEDPVAEVRKWRAELLKEVGGTLEGLAALIRKPGEVREEDRRRAQDSDVPRRKSA